MSRMLLTLGTYESDILWKFLDGVSTAVSRRMVGGSSPGEENLTFLLCELLDSNATSLHALTYPLSQAKRDLEESDLGLTFDVEFETHEHSKHVESKYSGADLGIVISIDHPILGRSRRGILVQAKRLFAVGKTRAYGLASQYNSFDRSQAEFLKTLQERFGVDQAVYYLWYNPSSTAFPDDDARVLKAYDAYGFSSFAQLIIRDPLMDHLARRAVYSQLHFGRRPAEPSAGDESRLKQWRQTQPALRLSALEAVLWISRKGVPQLQDLYSSMSRLSGALTFSPFADFILLALALPSLGSKNADWLRLAEGQKVPMPALEEGRDGHDKPDGMESPPIPRHTLRLTVRSTLPQDLEDLERE